MAVGEEKTSRRPFLSWAPPSRDSWAAYAIAEKQLSTIVRKSERSSGRDHLPFLGKHKCLGATQITGHWEPLDYDNIWYHMLVRYGEKVELRKPCTVPFLLFCESNYHIPSSISQLKTGALLLSRVGILAPTSLDLKNWGWVHHLPFSAPALCEWVLPHLCQISIKYMLPAMGTHAPPVWHSERGGTSASPRQQKHRSLQLCNWPSELVWLPKQPQKPHPVTASLLRSTRAFRGQLGADQWPPSLKLQHHFASTSNHPPPPPGWDTIEGSSL